MLNLDTKETTVHPYLFLISLIYLVVHFLNQERSIIATPKSIIWRNVFQVKFGRALGFSPPEPSGGGIVWGSLDWAGLQATNSTSNRAAPLWSVLGIEITVLFPLKRGFCCFNYFSTNLMLHSAHQCHWYLPHVTQKMGLGNKPGSVFLYTSLGA